jgi:Skp family chaperone for outer membrane proteins
MSRTITAALAALAASAAVAHAASEPAPTATPKAQPSLGGPLIKGVCLLSEDVVLRDAKVSINANKRLQQLKDQAQAEVNAARAPIDADYKVLQADASKGPAADIEKRRLAIQARYQTVQEMTDQRNREIEATRVKAVGRISIELQPVVAAAYKARGCGLLFNRNAVLGGNLGGDLSDDVVKGLDARITSLAFDRENLPPPAK